MRAGRINAGAAAVPYFVPAQLCAILRRVFLLYTEHYPVTKLYTHFPALDTEIHEENNALLLQLQYSATTVEETRRCKRVGSTDYTSLGRPYQRVKNSVWTDFDKTFKSGN